MNINCLLSTLETLNHPKILVKNTEI